MIQDPEKPGGALQKRPHQYPLPPKADEKPKSGPLKNQPNPKCCVNNSRKTKGYGTFQKPGTNIQLPMQDIISGDNGKNPTTLKPGTKLIYHMSPLRSKPILKNQGVLGIF
ncbi:MAG: hypothetical protein WAT19_00045 [Ferruginibacter sp.]